MWGNLAIEETIDVVHRGAQLKVQQMKLEIVPLHGLSLKPGLILPI